jgi:putative transposase
MIRPRQVRLKLNKSQFQHCQKLSQESAKVWNSVKNFFWRTYRKKGIWLSESSLKRYISGKFALHSQSIQAIVEKFSDNLKSAHSLRKDNPEIRYPYKNKSWILASRSLLRKPPSIGKRALYKSLVAISIFLMAKVANVSYSNFPLTLLIASQIALS